MAGRPREFDRDAALKRIQHVFWIHGYDGTAMSDLVETTGLASARLYAAFGSKEQAFKQSIDLYRADEGAFADRALAEEVGLREALGRMLRDAVDVYTRPRRRGCMVVSAAMTCSSDNAGVRDWLEGHRRARRRSIVDRVRSSVAAQDLDLDPDPDLDAERVGDFFATVLDGLSVAARDGVSRQRLLSVADTALTVLPTRA